MLPFDIVRLAAGSLGSNKLRSGLTMAGITVGIFSVVGVMTALSALKHSIDSGLHVLGTNTFQVQKFPAIMSHESWRKYHNRPSISYHEARRFKELMDGEAETVSLSLWSGVYKISYQDQISDPVFQLNGTDEGFVATNVFNLEYGRNLTPEDVEYSRSVMVIGKEAERKLFPRENPLGKTISVGRFRYTVVGVLAEKGKVFGESRDFFLLAPVTRVLADVGRHDHWQSLLVAVRARSREAINETQEAAIGAMRLARRLEPEQPNNFEVISNDSLLQAFDEIAVQVGTGGLLISLIALIAAGVGIMNIMLVSVTERTREIGVRKSVGARKWDILKQFLLEAVFLSEIGGVFGIILGVLAGNGLARFMNVPMIFPWFWSFTALFVCSLVGVGFGFYPAWKAAGLAPVDALRFE